MFIFINYAGKELVNSFKPGKLQVFQGEYTGVNPDDPSDTINLREGYYENGNSSAPTFHYILKDVIPIE